MAPATTQDPWRLTVKLKSRRALLDYLEFHKITGRELARRADEVAKKKDKNASVGPGIVGHLIAGRRNSCSLTTASAIEGALKCPPGFLFAASLSPVADTMRHKKAS